MAAGKSSRINRQYKTKYRIRNWREYERGLRSRGDVTIWLSEDAIAAWIPPKNGLRGGQRRYSNLAVRTALTLRVVFSLPLRQTEGFLDSLLRLMGLNLKAPDHTPLSRRNQIVAVPPLTRSHDGPIDLIVDSTGLKILGCGEWNAHKHKASKKRRDWRKLHIGPVFLFRDDFRRCTDSEGYPLNLMLFTGLPETGWEASWYASIEEIADPGKALARWLGGGMPLAEMG